MSKIKKIIGIDVSKLTLDVYDKSNGHSSYSNDKSGFQALFKNHGAKSHYVMEATGCYHQQLAMFLYSKNSSVSVVNPLVIKRFLQMKLQKLKTDKSDAKMIHHYGEEQSLMLWKPSPAYLNKCKRNYNVIRLYLKQTTALKNTLNSLASSGVIKGKIVRSLNRQLKSLEKEISILELEIITLIKEYDSDLFKSLKSIPGIGKKTALLLIIHTNGFKDFENYKQVISYFGLAPMERSSGTSVRGKTRINKSGEGTLRNHLFMCSFTACHSNPQCRALYERLVNKGKSKKLALIAVCNKLIKQAFGIAKSGLLYDKNYRSLLS